KEFELCIYVRIREAGVEHRAEHLGLWEWKLREEQWSVQMEEDCQKSVILANVTLV
ncbi:hypothetical protein SERLADRAFT_382398, partial [Serpula lacrymans var. lacrymans S7.9]